jgi:hypothetical protein
MYQGRREAGEEGVEEEEEEKGECAACGGNNNSKSAFRRMPYGVAVCNGYALSRVPVSF